MAASLRDPACTSQNLVRQNIQQGKVEKLQIQSSPQTLSSFIVNKTTTIKLVTSSFTTNINSNHHRYITHKCHKKHYNTDTELIKTLTTSMSILPVLLRAASDRRNPNISLSVCSHELAKRRTDIPRSYARLRNLSSITGQNLNANRKKNL